MTNVEAAAFARGPAPKCSCPPGNFLHDEECPLLVWKALQDEPSADMGAQQAADRAYREGQMFRDLREAVELLERIKAIGQRWWEDGPMNISSGDAIAEVRTIVVDFLDRLDAEKKEGT